MITDLRAPFPYFGGKSTVAKVVWAALGQPKHYLEPFFGSGAVLLARPDYRPDKHMETICDADGHICNVWRALQHDPDAVAKVCDWPVNHADLNARRKYMLENTDLLKRLTDDPEYYNVTMAGYWMWAASCWIGSGLTRPVAMPDTTNAKGVHKQQLYDPARYPDRIAKKGVHKGSIIGGRPQVGVQGAGVHQVAVQRLETPDGRPQLSCPQGVHQVGQIPSIVAGHETGVHRISQIPSIRDDKASIIRSLS